MPITVVLPSALHAPASGRGAVTVAPPCASLRDALAALAAECPGVVDRILTEQGDLRPHVNLFVGAENSRFMGGLDAPVAGDSVITVLAAVSGG